MTGVFLVMVVENLGIPFPTEIGFIIAQGLITTGQIGYFEAIIIITLAHVFGGVLAYSVGRWGDRKTKTYFENSPHLNEAKARLTKWYDEFGNATVFITRLIGYVRPWSSLIAGFAQVPFWSFLFWTTAGSLIFVTVSLWFTHFFVRIWRIFPDSHLLIIVAMFILFFGIILFELIRRVHGQIKNRRAVGK